jgi:transcriptional regulator GlxA family with amidase domain
MRVGLLVMDGYFGSGVSSMLDILGAAEMTRGEIDPAVPALEVEVVSPHRRATSSAGATLAATRSLDEIDDLDLLVVTAIATFTAADTVARVEGRDGRAVVRALQSVDPVRCRLAAACTGVFALAEAGVLDDRRATTTWFLTPAFRARYPAVEIDLDRMVVADGPTLTAGAAFAHIDLALAILRGTSVQLARHVAHLLLVDERASQAAYVVYDRLVYDDPLVRAFEGHVREHLDRPFNVSAAAGAVGASRRTLERKTREVVGMTPLEIVRQLRLERANHLQRTTDLSAESIARRVGYANAETLRALRRRSPNRSRAGDRRTAAAPACEGASALFELKPSHAGGGGPQGSA